MIGWPDLIARLADSTSSEPPPQPVYRYWVSGNWQHRQAGGAGRKLTDDDVRDICRRAAAGEMQASIARAYGLTRSYVGRIVRRRVRA